MNHKAAILMIPLVHMIATNLHIFNISYYGEETFNAYHFSKSRIPVLDRATGRAQFLFGTI